MVSRNIKTSKMKKKTPNPSPPSSVLCTNAESNCIASVPFPTLGTPWGHMFRVKHQHPRQVPGGPLKASQRLHAHQHTSHSRQTERPQKTSLGLKVCLFNGASFSNSTAASNKYFKVITDGFLVLDFPFPKTCLAHQGQS